MMNLNKMKLKAIPIHNKQGEVVNELVLPEEVEHIEGGRVSKGNKHYYKGAGSLYSSHGIKLYPDENEYRYLRKNDVFYSGYRVSKYAYEGKFGIFTEPFQWFYTDWIGACGIKEGLIVLNSTIFGRSSVEVIDVLEIDKEENQNCYVVDYKCDRKKFVPNNGEVIDLVNLITYMLESDWNFLWDKNAIDDITVGGMVADVADLFQSNELKHKVGTVHAVLHSLYKMDVNKYVKLLVEYGLNHTGDISFVENSVLILDKNGIDVKELLISNVRSENYFHILENYLFEGKNCAHCACDMWSERGDVIKEQYKRKMLI
jgi:hypothetical protein